MRSRNAVLLLCRIIETGGFSFAKSILRDKNKIMPGTTTMFLMLMNRGASHVRKLSVLCTSTKLMMRYDKTAVGFDYILNKELL